VSRTKNIKIAPPVGAARPEKRLSYALFEPFQQLFSETRSGEKCTKNLHKNRIQEKQSISAPSDDHWFLLYKYLKPILLTALNSESNQNRNP